MTYIKSLIADMVSYTGYYVVMLGEKITDVGARLHIKYQTKTGKKLQEIQSIIERSLTQVEDMIMVPPKEGFEKKEAPKTYFVESKKNKLDN